jgi:hypothetical protein
VLDDSERAGGHVDERTRAVLGEGFFEAGDGFDLAFAHAARASGYAMGMALNRARSVSGSATHSARVSGRWKVNTRRERGAGSRSSRKKVSTPVDS